MPFPYFGRKQRIAHLYPYPRFDTIVEPFAGSAGYAMHADNWTRNVILVERDPDIAGLWRWLIDPATTPNAIMAIPDIVKGQTIADVTAHGPTRKLLQLSAASENHNKMVVSEWMARDWPRLRARIAADVHKVKRWTVIEGDYTDAPDVEATWFIDPPYQRIVHGYNNTRDTIDFRMLGEWCRNRRGQTIVCEESGADWLPFVPLIGRTTINNTDTVEVWWSSEPTSLFSHPNEFRFSLSFE